MRAAGLFWIAMSYELEMKDSYPLPRPLELVRAWRSFSLFCFSPLLFASELVHVALSFAYWSEFPIHAELSLTQASWPEPTAPAKISGSSWTPR